MPRTHITAFAISFLTLGTLTLSALAGPLSPPAGPIAPTGKPLDSIEPRVCINDLAGDEGAVVLITSPGQYFLDADIVGQPGQHGIRIVATGDVRIDLNGFSVTGVPGSLNGIDMDLFQGAAPSRLDVRCSDGSCRSSVSGWGGDGLRSCHVPVCCCTHLLFENNGGNGIAHLHAEGVIHRDIATRGNAGDGTFVTPPIQATAGSGVTNRFAVCRARSNGGSGWNIDARAGGYEIDIDECYACANAINGVRVREDHISYGSGGGGGRIALRATSIRDSGGDGVHIEIPCASPCVVSCDELACVSNTGDGFEIDAVGAAVPHFGATCTILDSEFSSNGENGLRSENPLYTGKTTCGSNVLYGARVSGGDENTCVLHANVCHFAANGAGGTFGGPGRFMKVACSITDNGGNGVETTDGCLLMTDCSVVNNDGSGAVTNGTLNVVDSNFRRNSGSGVRCANGECVADGMVCEFNGTGGITDGGMVFIDCPSVTLRRCVSNGNTGDGVNSRSSVGPIKWMAPEMMVANNTGDGFDLDDCVGAQLERCMSTGNAGVGFRLGASFTRGRIDGCSSADDTGGGIWVLGSSNVVMNCSATANAVGAFDISPQSPSAPVITVGELATNRTPNVNIVY